MSEPTLVTFKKQREKIVNLVSGAEQKFFGKEQKFFSFNTWKFFHSSELSFRYLSNSIFQPVKRGQIVTLFSQWFKFLRKNLFNEIELDIS